jgi:hypothetical protein
VTRGVPGRLARYGPRSARAVRLLRRPETYRSIAREALWTLRPQDLPTQPSSWPLPTVSGGLSVGWPQRSPWPGALRWVETLRQGLAAHVPIDLVEIEQPYVNMVFFDVRVGDLSHRVAIDYGDANELSAATVDSARLIFKLQYAETGYGTDDVVPGGYIVGQPQLYKYLSRLRRTRDRDAPRYEVYGRFGPHGLPVRERVVTDLVRQDRFAFHGSLGTVLYVESLCEAARSRVCVDLPGRGYFCYRLADYLSIGSCIVAIPHENRLHVPLVDGEHIALAAPDGSDFVDRCTHYLEHDDERTRLVHGSREYFDRYLHPDQLAAYYLTTLLERL